MKRVIFLGLVIALITGSCMQEKKSPIEGAWQLSYGKWTSLEQTFPDQLKGSDIKIWSTGYWIFAGQYKLDTLIQDNYGQGTYTLNGNQYEEKVAVHVSKAYVGKTVRMLIEIKNDTLIQKWPVDETWKLAEKYNIEKYTHLK
jgi:hypothetical protein